MATATPTPSFAPNTALYKLVSDRLGRDPLELIRERRSQTPPMPFVRIAHEILEVCNRGGKNRSDHVYLTHEVPRRWLIAADRAAERAAAESADSTEAA